MAQPLPGPFRHLTDRSRAAIASATGHAMRLGHGDLSPEHLLLGLCGDQSMASMVLAGLGISPHTLREQVEQRLPTRDSVVAKHLVMSSRIGQVLEYAQLCADKLGYEFVSTDHLLAAIGEVEGVAQDVLTGLGATPAQVSTEALRLLGSYTRGDTRPDQEPTADQLIGARLLAVPAALRDYSSKITDVRQEKEAAVDNQEYERAAQIRETEKQLVAERQNLVRSWVADVDLVLVVTELDRVYRETQRLGDLLAGAAHTDDEDAVP